MPIMKHVPDQLDSALEQARAAWGAPGMAVAVVEDGALVFAKGYGARAVGEAAPVDEHTLFACASTSKAFTAVALGMLVDEGRLTWDDPATKYLPGFQLYDPYVSREISIRDLLCHRSGLPRGDLAWYGADVDRAELLRRVRHLKPEWSFRARFGYQNIMYVAAGEVVAAVSGQSWDDFVRARIFEPLGMARTLTSTGALAGLENVATPHHKYYHNDYKEGGAVFSIPWYAIDNLAAGGGIISSVADMAQWLRFNLSAGEPILDTAVLDEIQSPHMIENDPDRHKFEELVQTGANFWTYGLGWSIRDYRGLKLLRHGGSIDGMRAEVALLPSEGLGVVVLTNLTGIGDYLPNVAALTVLDAYLGRQGRDWSADFERAARHYREENDAERKKMHDARVDKTSPSLALDAFTGTYTDDLYGDALLTLEDGRLVLRRGRLVGDLEHWHHDTFRVIWRNPANEPDFVTFILDTDGRPAVLRVKDWAGFTRVQDQQSEDEADEADEVDEDE